MAFSSSLVRSMGFIAPTILPCSRPFVGGSSVVTTAKISKRFDFVTALGVPNEVTSLDTVGGNENVIFTCIPASHPKANEAYANTKNNQKLPAPAGGEAPQPVNLIRFTPRGLQVCLNLLYIFGSCRLSRCRTPNRRRSPSRG
jgi:hypothetical protein